MKKGWGIGERRGLPWACFVASSVSTACGNQSPLPPVGGDCTMCGTSTSTSTSTGSGTGGVYRDARASDAVQETGNEAGGPDAGPVSVEFNVSRTNDTSFINVSPYEAPVKVSAVDTAGAVVSTTSAGSASTGKLEGVATGPNWFAVEDPASIAKILPTLQPISVDPVTPVAALVTIATSQLTPLVVDRDQQWAPIQGRATLILIFNRGGRLLSGISMNGSLPPGASVAYEQRGAYVTAMTNPDVATDDEGTAIVRDIPNVATFPATTPMKFGYRIGTATLSFDARLSADFVTWMTVSVP